MIINKIKDNFIQAQEVLGHFISDPGTWKKIEKAGDLLVQALRSGNKIISCGNGGSMCDAMHFAEELTGRFHNERRPLPAIAISDPANITCVANDYGFDYVFSRTIEALGKNGDVLLALSTSGNSINIIKAIDSAMKAGMKVIALTGNSGGHISGLCDVEIRVPHSGYSDRIQEIHIMVIHSLVNYVEISLFTE